MLLEDVRVVGLVDGRHRVRVDLATPVGELHAGCALDLQTVVERIRRTPRDHVHLVAEFVAERGADEGTGELGKMSGGARLTSGSLGFDEPDVRAAAVSVFDRAGQPGAGSVPDRAGPAAKAQRASHLGGMFAAIDGGPR